MSFLFCVILFYRIFLVSAAASVGAKRTSTGCPAPLYLPLSEFVNTGGTINIAVIKSLGIDEISIGSCGACKFLYT